MRLIKGVIATKGQERMTILAELGLSFNLEAMDEFSVGDPVEIAVDFTTNEISQIRMAGSRLDSDVSEPIVEPEEEAWVEEKYRPTSEEE